MNPGNTASETASGTTSSSAPKPPAGKPAGDSTRLSEAEYLSRQADEAKAAIAGAFADLKTDLAKGVDPRVWMKSHPWMTLASAAVAGFATAAAVVPSKEDQALRKLAALERALDGSGDSKEHNGNGKRAHASAGGGFVGLILKELVGVVKPILITLVTTHLKPESKDAHESDNKRDSDPRSSG